jgi:hypothetical protein
MEGYGLMIVDLNNIGYKDDPWVVCKEHGSIRP